MSAEKLAEALRECAVIRAAVVNDDASRALVRLQRVEMALKAVIAAHSAEQEQAGEAVAWLVTAGNGKYTRGFYESLDAAESFACCDGDEIVPLYTRPQQPLSESEAASIFKAWREGPLWLHMTRGVEAAQGIGITKDTK